MTTEFEWNERFNIGVDVIDNAHQKLFSIVRKILNFSEDEKNSQWACTEGIKFFKSYAIKHFTEEEEYMQSIGYKGYEMHKRLHDNMRDKVIPALEYDLEYSNYSPESVQHFLGICIGWLTGHIIVEDRAITGKIDNKWKLESAGEEIKVLEDAVITTMFELFKLRTLIVSEHYSGENFGSCLAYRLTYKSNDGKALQIFLAIEDSLIIHTVSSILNMTFNKVNKLATEATKQIAPKWVKQIGKHFDLPTQYKFDKIHVMTIDQLQQEFDTAYPYYSLLFDTGVGYFAFCIKLLNKK